MPTKLNIPALDVAKYVIYLASQNVIGDEGEIEGITNLKLQKILYFIEAFSLATKDTSIFNEEIEAWEYGPVVPEVYHAYKDRKSNPIFVETDYVCELPNDVKDTVDKVWSTFEKFSASRLVDITHRHRPWIDANENPETDLINRESIKEYYTGLFTDDD